MWFPRLSTAPLFISAALAFPVSLTAQRPAGRVTLAQFRQLNWLSGSWRGSGGGYAAFFEEYRRVNDSTIVMRAFSDSTFRVGTDSSRIEWRNGVVSNRGSGSSSIAVELTANTVRFVPEGASSGGFTFTRVSPEQWTATLHPKAAT